MSKRKSEQDLLSDLIHCHLRKQEDFLINLGNPYYNFMERLETTVSSYQYYDFDLLEDIVIGAVSSCQTFPENISAFYQQLMQEITHSFQVSASPHYLVWPLQKALLTEDIHFGNFWLLSPKTPQELEAQISNLSGISQQEVAEFLAHTQRSRSPDFMKSCLAVIQLTHQTGFVNKMAYSYAQTTTQLLRLLHISENMKNDLWCSSDAGRAINCHVAILSENPSRCGHGFHWNPDLLCPIPLDFMGKQDYQELFLKLFQAYSVSHTADSFSRRCINAHHLFQLGYQQKKKQENESVSLVLYMTALESLLTEDKPGKRDRLAKVLPQLIQIHGHTPQELGQIVDVMYQRRSEFVHGGRAVRIKYEDNSLQILEQAIAKLFILLTDVNSLISNASLRQEGWKDYIESLYAEPA